MLTFYAFRAGRFLAPLIPPAIAHFLCLIAGDLLYVFNEPARKAVRDNLRHVLPSENPLMLKVTSRQVFRNTVENYYDLLRLPSMNKRSFDKAMQVHGLANLENALEAGKGAIMLSIHMGNFNVVAQTPVVNGIPTNIIVEHVQPQALHDLLTQMRESMGMQMIPLDGSHLRKAYKVLKHNEVLGMMGDRDIAGTGESVRFFGEVTEMPSGAVVLALRTGAAIVPSYTFRTGTGKSIGFIEPAIELARTGDRRRDVIENLQQIALILEGYIRQAPGQWTVLQRVWDLTTD